MNIKNLLTFLILFTSSFHSYSQIYKLDAKTFLDVNISKKEYKIEISVGDQKAAVFADANGNWIKK